MNKFKNFVKKIVQPTPLDKIIIGKAKPLEADKLKGNKVLEVNDKIFRKRMSDPQIFRWNETFWAALCFSPMIYIFLKNDSILLNIVGIIVYLCICIATLRTAQARIARKLANACATLPTRCWQGMGMKPIRW